MKLKDYLLNPLFAKIFRYSLALLLSLSIFLGIFFTSDKSLTSICDACFVPGVVMLAIAFFSILNLFGTFDLAEYGTISIVQSFKKDDIIQYKDLIDYKEKKSIKREKNRFIFLPYLIFGIIWIIISIVIRIMLSY